MRPRGAYQAIGTVDGSYRVWQNAAWRTPQGRRRAGLTLLRDVAREIAVRLPGLIKDRTVVTVEGGPHNIACTRPEAVNKALLDFLAT